MEAVQVYLELIGFESIMANKLKDFIKIEVLSNKIILLSNVHKSLLKEILMTITHSKLLVYFKHV